MSLLTGLVVASLLAAAPRVELVGRNNFGVDEKTASTLRERFRKAMTAEGLDATSLAEPCTDSACLKALAREHDVVVVGMTIAKGKKGFTIDLEALDARGSVLQQTFVISSDRVERSPDAQVFAKELALRLAPPEPEPSKPLENTDVPVKEPQKKVVLAPEETTPDYVEERPAPRALPRVVLVSGAVVAVAGLAMIIGGAVSAGELDKTLQAPVVTSLTRPQAQAQADGANALMGLGSATLVAGAVAVVTGVAMISAD